MSVDISTSWPEEKKRTFDRSVLPSGPRASSALEIDRSRLPSSPPYTVYLGNLSFECTEEDIIRFFQRKKLVVSYCSVCCTCINNCGLGSTPYTHTHTHTHTLYTHNTRTQASSVRLPVESGTNRMRGFGYAEFDTISDLMEALSLNKEVGDNSNVYCVC